MRPRKNVVRPSDNVYKQAFSYLSEVVQCLGGFERYCGSKERTRPAKKRVVTEDPELVHIDHQQQVEEHM